MNDVVPEAATDFKLADLQRRVEALESKVASLPDARQIDERIKANLPPPVDPTQPPTFKDLALPIPDVDTIVSTARTTWALVEVFAEIKLMLWMLLDRRYHMGWLTRLAAIGLVIAFMLSYLWVPFGGYDNFVSRMIGQAGDLVLGLILFMVLMFETRRYKEWRKGRS